MKEKSALLILIALFIFIAIPRISFPELDHGDEFTDANVLDAGKNFVNLGFIKSRFLPMFEPNLDRPKDAYTHVPPLSENFNGLLRTIFKTDFLFFFRIISLAASFLTILFWYLFIRRFGNSCLVSFLAAIFYLSSPFFIYGMDSLQESCYSQFLLSLVLFISITMIRCLTEKRRRRILFVLWLLAILETLATFEYVIYFSLFIMLFGFLRQGPEAKISRKEILILLTAPVCGFLLHFLQNAWYFNSFLLAFQDLKNIAIQRIANSSDAPAMTLSLWWQYVILRNFSLVFLFDYFTLFLCAFFGSLLYSNLSLESKQKITPLFKLLIIFIICGVSWYLFFPSHSFAHAFVNFLARHLVPAAAIGFVLFFYILVCFIKEKMPRAFLWNIPLLVIILVVMYTGIIKSELPVTFEKIKSAQEFIKFKTCLLELKEKSRPSDIIGVNYWRNPFIRYYTSRNCQGIFGKAALEKLPVLPRYFIFMPYNNVEAEELFRFLNQKYVILFQCDSARFPSIFFELKNQANPNENISYQ